MITHGFFHVLITLCKNQYTERGTTETYLFFNLDFLSASFLTFFLLLKPHIVYNTFKCLLCFITYLNWKPQYI